MTRRTFYIETYGCQMNVSDSELMYGALAREGYDAVDGPIGADVVLVNTCAIRENAEQRVIGRLGELRRDLKVGAVLGVTGCMAQRLGPRLLETDTRVQLVVGLTRTGCFRRSSRGRGRASGASPPTSTSRSITRM